MIVAAAARTYHPFFFQKEQPWNQKQVIQVKNHAINRNIQIGPVQAFCIPIAIGMGDVLWDDNDDDPCNDMKQNLDLTIG